MRLPEELMDLIRQGENLTVEFKKSTTDITKDVYDTVCSFSNRDGGHIFFGVKDDGTVLGVDKNHVEQMKKDFVTTINNDHKMYPPLYLTMEEYEVDEGIILYVYVPMGKTVYRNAGRIYDRNNESDIDITDNSDMVFHLYARKQNTYFVNKVYPAIPMSRLRHDLMERARRMTRVNTEHHPWVDMTDEEMLRSCGLILEDPETNKEGITLAAILLFGTDSTIMSVLPQHKTDAIFRVINVDRYDDRDVIITNLIESYDRLMAFGQKHLNDIFVMDGIQRVSARDKILREIISNLLMHRDFSSGYVPKLLIERDTITTENANLAHGHGNLNLSTFKPFAKNPPIAKVFREIGLADELGSGMRNSYKYTKMYSGAEPIFTEADVFTIVIPLSEAATVTVGPSVVVNKETDGQNTSPEDGSLEKENTKNGSLDGSLENERLKNGSLGDDFKDKKMKKNSPDDALEDKRLKNGSLEEENTKNGSLENVGLEDKLLDLLRQNPEINATDLSCSLDIGTRTCYRMLEKLKSKGIIERVGGRRYGCWKVK